MTEEQQGYGTPALPVGGISLGALFAAVATWIAAPLAGAGLRGAMYEKEMSA